MNRKNYLDMPLIGECREKEFNGRKVITKRLDYNCPWCHSPVLFKQVVTSGRPRPPFKGCSNYPHCDWTDYKEPV